LIFNYEQYKIFLACGKTDMRKSINGLCELVQYRFNLDPREKIVFVFCNQQRNRIKILVWEDNGFWVHFKRLEKGSIDWPVIANDEMTMDICLDELINIIKRPGIKQKIKRQEIWKNP